MTADSKGFVELLEATKDVVAPTVNTLDKDYAGELSRKFVARYKDTFNEINSVLAKAYHEFGEYQIPVPALTLEDGQGFTEFTSQAEMAITLAAPAVMATKLVKHKEISYLLRVGIPWGTVQEVYNNEAYFGEFFDALVGSSFNAIAKKYGQPKYGDVFMTPDRPGGKTLIFTDNGDGLEIRFHGKFAGGQV